MNTNELGLLINALKNKESGFYFVEVLDNNTLGDLILKIKVALGQFGKKLSVVDFLTQDKDEPISAFFKKETAKNDSVNVFLIKNLETASAENPANFLRQLNQAREAIYSNNKNFVFIVYHDFSKLFMMHAKDLFSWMPHRYCFNSSTIAPREFASSVKLTEKIRFRGDKDRKYIIDLIKLYEKQMHESTDDQNFRINNILKPLADLYREYGDYAKEIPLREEIKGFNEGKGYEFADSLINLGNAYNNLPTGDRASNLKYAIDAYNKALKIRTIDAFPTYYAMTMNNLGLAYQNLPTGDRASNLKYAIDAYNKALKIHTIDAFPTDYAMTMNNLGLAYQNLPTGDRASNLKYAIDAYNKALKIHTIDAFPTDYAMTMNNLGTCLPESTDWRSSIKPEMCNRCI